MHDVQIHIYSCIDNQSEINGFKFGDHLHSFDVRCYLVLRVDHPTYETVMPSPYTHTHTFTRCRMLRGRLSVLQLLRLWPSGPLGVPTTCRP